MENIGVAKLGAKSKPNEEFTGKAIAKVLRFNGDSNYVVVVWDSIREKPSVVFDPCSASGMVSEFIHIHTYDWDEIRKKDEALAENSKRIGVKRIHDMDLSEINIELLYIHGMKQEKLDQYKSIVSRQALLAQLRSTYEQDEA